MNHLGWGLQISALGMGLVFGLLVLLWGLLALAGRLDRQAPGDAEAPKPPAQLPTSAAASPEAALAPELVAAITIATLTHRTRGRHQAAPEARQLLPGSQLHASRWVAAGRMRQNLSWRRPGR